MQFFKDILDHRVRARWWQLWSNQFAVAVAVAAAWAVENQHTVMEWVNQIEQPYRSALTFAVFVAIPVTLRMAPQLKLARKLDQEKDA
jgi:predicted Co/Zn/Cd cation transporter (cation efflux family)